jgi:hypothetical protein
VQQALTALVLTLPVLQLMHPQGTLDDGIWQYQQHFSYL